MTRRRWSIAGAILALAVAACAYVLRPRPPEEFPLAELVPSDAIFYAGFPDHRELQEVVGRFVPADLLQKVDAAKPHLSGATALYVDRESEWVFLARLTRGAAMVAGGEIENGAYVTAETPEALARHKSRKAPLSEDASFLALRSRFFLNLEALKLRSRGRDFSAAGFEVTPGDPWNVRGRVLYRGGLIRMFLQSYVQAPKQGVPEPTGPFQAAMVEHFPRVWEEVLHELSTIDREKAEREAYVLSRDYLEGKSLREFLGRLGPSWGLALSPTPHGVPAASLWIDLPDKLTRDRFEKMIHRAAGDAIKVRKDTGRAPAFDLAPADGMWHVRFPWAASLRLGEAFTPAYKVERNRFILTTCASVLSAPAVPAGESHLAASIRVAPLVEAARSLVPLLADGRFRDEAERSAALFQLRVVTPATLGALRRQFPDASDLAKFLETQKAQFEAKSLEEISRTPRYADEVARIRGVIDTWAGKISWLDRVAWTGRFTGEGLQFELKAWPAAAR